MLEAFGVATLLVAIAEIGDKTQLLSFVLAARLRQPLAIVAGILVATLANHALAAAVGGWIAAHIDPALLKWILAAAFVACGLWALVPDRLDEPPSINAARSAFVTTTIAFFLLEMGDKTQVATVALAARYDALAAVVLGTTLGMLIANVPAVWLGQRLAERLDLTLIRRIAAGLFFALALLTVLVG
jgi:Ca2+/H+ antiporter, TMEM165/GDT1 family